MDKLATGVYAKKHFSYNEKGSRLLALKKMRKQLTEVAGNPSGKEASTKGEIEYEKGLSRLQKQRERA